jgi:hypothetical protein
MEVDFTQTLLRLQEESFLPQHTNRFSEADLLTRTLLAMVADLFHVAMSVIFVSNNPKFTSYVDRRIILE